MTVLYRKYRPQTFSEVVGQRQIIQTLKSQVDSGQISHAYIFTGMRGVGKTSIARILAKALNCLKIKDGEPCGKCQVCKQTEHGRYMDLVEIDAASSTGVDNIRDLIEHVKFSPSAGRYKVFIIDEVHMLSKGAFNALLKTLEEPPLHAIFILATTEISKVPATIISRSQRFDFKRISKEDLVIYLSYVLKQEKVKLQTGVVELVAEQAEGGGRDALSLMEKVLTLGEQATMEDVRAQLGVTDVARCEELLTKLIYGQVEAIPSFVIALSEQGVDFSIFNKDFLEYLRKALTLKMTGHFQGSELDAEKQEVLRGMVLNISLPELMFIIRLFLRSYKEIGDSPSADIPILLAAAEAAHKYSAKNLSKPSIIQHADPALEKLNKPKNSVQPNGVAASVLGQNAKINNEISLPEVRLFWPAVIDKIKDINGPLANLVKNSPIQAVLDGQIILGVKYAFHKQNLENPKHLMQLAEAVEKISGKTLGVVAQMVKDDAVDARPTPESLGEALKIFGGEVMD